MHTSRQRQQRHKRKGATTCTQHTGASYTSTKGVGGTGKGGGGTQICTEHTTNHGLYTLHGQHRDRCTQNRGLTPQRKRRQDTERHRSTMGQPMDTHKRAGRTTRTPRTEERRIKNFATGDTHARIHTAHIRGQQLLGGWAAPGAWGEGSRSTPHQVPTVAGPKAAHHRYCHPHCRPLHHPQGQCRPTQRGPQGMAWAWTAHSRAAHPHPRLGWLLQLQTRLGC